MTNLQISSLIDHLENKMSKKILFLYFRQRNHVGGFIASAAEKREILFADLQMSIKSSHMIRRSFVMFGIFAIIGLSNWMQILNLLNITEIQGF